MRFSEDIPFLLLQPVQSPLRQDLHWMEELKDFQKITLQPGEEKVVEFVITEPKLRFLTADHGYESEAGMFEVYVGTDSMAEEKRMFRLEK